MVARISCGRSIKSALHYNETKIAEGKATLLLSSRFGCDADDLSVRQKLARFESLISRNKKVKTNTLHVSLNFAPGECLAPATLQYLAADYMQRIGFADQPFLVYQHHDAGHPHIHIVTTNIRQDGRAISLHNIGRLKSEPARKALEQIYGLIVAEGRRQRAEIPVSMAPAHYGKSETKQAISNIVREVTSTFQYTTLAALNAALQYYNVTADPGQPGSLCWNRRGLTYSIVNADGVKVGVPIAASSIYSLPVLSALERRMETNRELGKHKRRRLCQVLDKVLAAHSSAAARQVLKRYNVTFHQAARAENSDMFLIDHRNRSVVSVYDEGYDVSKVQQILLFEKARAKACIPQDQITGVEFSPLVNSARLLRELTSDVQPYGEYLNPELIKKKRRRKL